MGYLNEEKEKKGNWGLKQYYRPMGPNRHIWNIPYNSSRISMFLNMHRIIFGTDHNWGHNTSLKFKKLEVLPSIISSHKEMKLEINNKTNWKMFKNFIIK